jgi:hypothetical protein
MTDNGIQNLKLKGVANTPELEAALEGIRSVTIERPVLHAAVTKALRKLIVEGTLPPGTRLNERDLCASLGVSRTPLREALKALAAEGLIEHQPNRGAVVPVLSEADIIDAFELLGVWKALRASWRALASLPSNWPSSRHCIRRCSRATPVRTSRVTTR